MFSFEDLEKIRQAMAQLGNDRGDQHDEQHSKRSKGKKCHDSPQNTDDDTSAVTDCINLGPAQILVIAGFLTGVLQVNSILVNRQQAIEIVLSGSLKKPTQMDKVMEQIGRMPFERVIQSILNNIE